jgi:hypothetical protein
MKLKYRLMRSGERFLNVLAKPVRMHVHLSAGSSLHNQPVTWHGDGLITSHTVNFLSDERFQQTLAFVRSQVSHPCYHEFRIYMAVSLAELARKVPDTIFVECGVGEGILSLAINHYLTGIPRSYLVDTYGGIDPKYLEATELAGQMSAEARSQQARAASYPKSDFASVQKRFEPYTNVHLVKGSVPDVLHANAALFNKRVSWLHLDMNNAAPEYSALKFFWPKLSVPGFVLLDDYAFIRFLPQKQAIDRACEELGVAKPISLPTGQGLLIKVAD